MFLDGTYLNNHFDTLLSVPINADNRVIPIERMLHMGNEDSRNLMRFLSLVRKYIPYQWCNIDIMYDQSVALQTSIKIVFKKAAWHVQSIYRVTLYDIHQVLYKDFSESIFRLWIPWQKKGLVLSWDKGFTLV